MFTGGDFMSRDTEKWFSDRMKRTAVEMLIGVFAILVLSFICLSDGIDKRNEYIKYNDVAVPVTATVSDVHEKGNKYTVYVTYEYNKESFENFYWKTTEQIYSNGKTVEIRVKPNGLVFDEDNGTNDFLLAGCLFVPSAAIIIAVAVRFAKKRKAKLEE